MNFKLSQKAIVLVSMPLVLGLVFVLILMLLLSSVDREQARQEHATEVRSRVNSMVSSLLQRGSLVAIRRLSDDHAIAERLDKIDPEFKSDYQKFKELIGDLAKEEMQEKKALEKFDGVILALVASQDKAKLHAEKGERAAASREWRKTERTTRELLDIGQRIIEEQRKIETGAKGSQAALRERIDEALWVGIGLNIFIAFLLAGAFHSVISKRLNVIVDNTRRMAAQKSPSVTMTGNDEISYIDGEFHLLFDQLQQAREKEREQEREVQRMKQEFVAMVVHDLRTPLTSIQHCLSLLEEGRLGSLDNDGKNYVHSAYRTTERMVGLLNDLLYLDHMEGEIPLECDDFLLSEIFELSLQSAAAALSEKRNSAVVEPCPLTVYCDRDRIVQVVSNLLVNAAKYSSPGSPVFIDFEDMDDSLIVSVTDVGEGIAADQLDKICNRFYQVDSTRGAEGGSGLGLYICRMLVVAHGGNIGVESTEGTGSRFWFSLPKKQSASRETCDLSAGD